LWQLKYFIRKVVLNSKNFGVAQSRERIFLLCSLSGETKEPVFPRVDSVPAYSIINTSGKYEFNPLMKKGRAEMTLQSAQRAITALGKSTPFLLVYYGSARNGNGGWQSLDEPLGTITTLDRFAYVIPGNHGHMMRMLQPEELKLAMGFNASFQLETIEGINRRDRIKLMGNGVCPPVMKAIIRSFISNGNN
jgi:DNA (cytosine-5)-methyltransferase 1